MGGVDLLLATQHGAGEVVGIDVEGQLVEASTELVQGAGLADKVRFMLVEPGPLPFPDQSFDLVFSKDAMVHIPDKTALYSEVLRVLKPGGAFVGADWLWADGAASSQVVQDWLSKGPLKFVFTTPNDAAAELRKAGFAHVSVKNRRHLLQVSNRKEIEVLEGPARERLASIVGQDMALARLASAHGRQGALDSGDLIPSHLFGRSPGRGAILPRSQLELGDLGVPLQCESKFLETTSRRVRHEGLGAAQPIHACEIHKGIYVVMESADPRKRQQEPQ